MLFPLPRRYTLTHNDVTGALALSIGDQYNSAQLEGWYVRMIRDEVLAEWRRDEKEGKEVEVEKAGGGKERSDSSNSSSSPASSSGHSLHIFCHVSGDARWLAPLDSAPGSSKGRWLWSSIRSLTPMLIS